MTHELVPALHLVIEARALVGVPYRHQGRTESGLDCVGLALLAAQRAKVFIDPLLKALPRRYGRIAEEQRYAAVTALCVACPPQEGALTLFRFPGDTHPRHFGILTAQQTVIHAEAQVHRRVVEHGFRAHWESRSVGCWQIPGVRYE